MMMPPLTVDERRLSYRITLSRIIRYLKVHHRLFLTLQNLSNNRLMEILQTTRERVSNILRSQQVCDRPISSTRNQ